MSIKRANTQTGLGGEEPKTHSRPYTSCDNPFSESHFNQEHYHSGIAYLTPETVHYGRAAEVLAARQARLLEAYTAHPERFPKGPPRVPELPEAVWINPPKRGGGPEPPRP